LSFLINAAVNVKHLAFAPELQLRDTWRKIPIALIIFSSHFSRAAITDLHQNQCQD